VKYNPNKLLSNDVINVKFKQKVLSGTGLIEKLNEKIGKLTDKQTD
jgi:hypothetical protein